MKNFDYTFQEIRQMLGELAVVVSTQYENIFKKNSKYKPQLFDNTWHNFLNSFKIFQKNNHTEQGK